MRQVGIFALSFFLFGCNLVRWNQKRLTNKFERKGIQEKTFSSDEHTIHYFEGGEGETVLLIHGFGGDAQMTWDRSIRDLAKDYHVIAPDLLWFGKSDSKAKPNLDAQVDALFQLLADRGVGNCSVMGISYGGFVTLAMHYKNPSFFNKICIVDSPGMTYDITLLDELCKQQKVASVEDIFVVKNQQDVKDLLDLAFYKSKRIPKSILKDTYELYFSNHHLEQAQLLKALSEQQKVFLDMGEIEFPPSTVIWGPHDKVFPISEGIKLADFMNAELVEIPKSGHAPNMENFKAFQAEVRRFLEN